MIACSGWETVRCRLRKLLIVSMMIPLSLALLLPISLLAVELDALEIVRKADQHLRGESSYAEITMRLERPDWSREISMKSWSKGNDLALILISAPARDQGTTFLKRRNEVWNYVPSVEKVIKIPPSMMMQSWMGSDFTNDDLVRESSVVEDYRHAILGDTTIDGRECWKLELVPKVDAAVVWGRLHVWIEKKNYLQLRVDYYDEDDELVNRMVMDDIRMMGGRLIPARMEMAPIDKPGNKTIMTYKALEFNKPIADNFFSEQNMKRVR